MELVTGITMANGRVTADAIDIQGRPCAVAPMEFASKGLPSLRAGMNAVVRTSFKDWKLGSFEEYAYALDFRAPAGDSHTVWVFHNEGRRYVVPALALIRTIGRRRALVYPHLFKPQSLEDLCAWDDKQAQVLVPGIPDYLPNQANQLGLRHNDTLGWMFCFPSARRAWASVYRAAKVGRLHMELPDATVTIQLGGRSCGRTDYAQSIRLLGVEPEEEPFEFASGHARHLASPPRPKAEDLASYVPLTDAQWNAVANIVLNIERPAAQPRESLDTMRLKAHDGLSWGRAAAVFGTSSARVAGLHAKWKASGKLERVNERLTELASSAGVEVADERSLAGASIGVQSASP